MAKGQKKVAGFTEEEEKLLRVSVEEKILRSWKYKLDIQNLYL